MRDIGKNIRDLRESKNLTQDQLAEKLFVTRQTVSNYETGKTRPDVDMILRIAQVLGTDANCVFYGMPENENRRRELIKAAVTALVAIAAVAALLLFRHYAMAYKSTSYDIGPAMLYGCLLRPLVMLGCGWCIMQVLSLVFKMKPIRSRTARIAQIVLIAVIAVIIVLMMILVLNSFQTTGPDTHPMKIPVIGTIINAVFWFDYYTYYCGYIIAGAAIWGLRTPKKPENAASDKPSCK